MTADVEMLPLPEATMKSYQTDSTMRTMTLYSYSASDMRDYARSCVTHATAAKDAEIEALRAEVERVTCELMDAITRADKLAEALRDAADDIDAGVPPEDAAAHLRARADLLRDQEEGQ